MLLNKLYQPDIYVFGEDDYRAQFMIEVLEDPSLEAIALEHMGAAMASEVCFRGAMVVSEKLKLLELEFAAVDRKKANVIGEVDLSPVLRRFRISQEDGSPVQSFYRWLLEYAASGAVAGLSRQDEEFLRLKFLPFVEGADIMFMPMHDYPHAVTF